MTTIKPSPLSPKRGQIGTIGIMSPRPAARRDDATAEQFLRAGAYLLDAALSEKGVPLPPRLRAIKFPAALAWLRLEDVIRMAYEESEVSRTSFRNRWVTRDDFVRDLVLYCLEYRDSHGLSAPQAYAARQILLDERYPASERVHRFVARLLRELLVNPRSLLLAHIAPMMSHHPNLYEALVHFSRDEHERWKQVYAEVLEMVGVQLRPGWTLDSLALALQCLLDGLVLRHRIDNEHSPSSDYAGPNFAADAILGVVMSALDLDGTGLTTAQWVDSVVDRQTRDTE